jgi:hypothetical protein
MIAAKSYRSADSPAQPSSLVGNGLTFYLLDNELHAAAQERALVYVAIASSPTTGVITFTFPETMQSFRWAIDRVDGADVSSMPTSFEVQSTSLSGTGGTSAVGSLAAFGSPTNLSYAVLSNFDNYPITPDSPLSLLVDGGTANQGRLTTAWCVDRDATPSGAFTGGSSDWEALSVEIKMLPGIAKKAAFYRMMGMTR